MTGNGMFSAVRGAVLGLVLVGMGAVLGGCGAAGGVRGTPASMVKSSSADFQVAFSTSAPGDEAVTVTPDDGDAWLESKKDPVGKDNKLTWTADRSFGIKFVQIDDPAKSPKKKFGNESDGWNVATCDASGTPCVFELTLERGKGNKNKEIRGAKYVVASPSGCSDLSPIPATCMHQDPVIIIRY